MRLVARQNVSRLCWVVCFCAAAQLGLAHIADRNQEFHYKPTPRVSLWPLPRYHWTIENQMVTFDPQKILLLPSNPEAVIQCDILREALYRYTALLRSERGPPIDPALPTIHQLLVTVKHFEGKGHCGYPKLRDNESYNLHISQSPPEATLSSPTVWGILRGLETFSQLYYQDPNSKKYLMNVTKIQDWPKFSHRGILVDTARHFIPLRYLKANLDAMAFNKMNVFHWHIVDDQAFPFESKTYPNLTTLGAYSPEHVYRRQDVLDLIEYARLRGIRVIPEFDTPGHTRSIGKAFPKLMTKCYYAPKSLQEPNRVDQVSSDGLDPSNEKTYKLVKAILEEFKDVFPDEYVHLGMDETNIECWMSNPRIQKFMMRRGIPNEQYLEEYYARRVINITQNMRYKYVIWEDPLENGVQVSPETVIQLWKPSWVFRAKQTAAKKHQMVLSSCWYINMIEYGEAWTKYYECNPLQFSQNGTDQALMLGGEACLWSEYIDATNFITILWPSAAAVAERLWNGEETLEADDECRRRFDMNRCRLLRRGINARPVYSGFCEEDLLKLGPILESTVLPVLPQPDTLIFIWVPLAVSVVGCLYWIMISRTLLRSLLCFRWCTFKNHRLCNRRHSTSNETKKPRT